MVDLVHQLDHQLVQDMLSLVLDYTGGGGGAATSSSSETPGRPGGRGVVILRYSYNI